MDGGESGIGAAAAVSAEKNVSVGYLSKYKVPFPPPIHRGSSLDPLPFGKKSLPVSSLALLH